MADRSQKFAPIPARAIADEELSALDLRVLACLAAHDRFGANGTGCFASHPRLAGLLRCHLKSLSRSLKTLAERGYIDAAPHPLNRRLRVYRVRYTGADDAVLKERIGNRPATSSEPKGNEMAPEPDAIGNQDFLEDEQFQDDADINILGEAYKISRETDEDKSAEAALRNEEDFDFGFDFDDEPRRFAIVLPSGAVRRVGVRSTILSNSGPATSATDAGLHSAASNRGAA